MTKMDSGWLSKSQHKDKTPHAQWCVHPVCGSRAGCEGGAGGWVWVWG